MQIKTRLHVNKRNTSARSWTTSSPIRGWKART